MIGTDSTHLLPFQMRWNKITDYNLYFYIIRSNFVLIEELIFLGINMKMVLLGAHRERSRNETKELEKKKDELKTTIRIDIFDRVNLRWHFVCISLQWEPYERKQLGQRNGK